MQVQDVFAPATVQVNVMDDAGRIQLIDELAQRSSVPAPPKASPRWLCASTTGNIGLSTDVTLVTSCGCGRYFSSNMLAPRTPSQLCIERDFYLTR